MSAPEVRPTSTPEDGSSATATILHAYENYKQTGQRDYLDHCISLCETAIRAAPPADAALGPLLNLMGLALKARFRIDRQLDDIDDAIGCFASASKEAHAMLTISAADAFRARFQVSRDPTDMDQAIRLYQGTLLLEDCPQHMRPTIWRSLVHSKANRGDATRLASDLEESVTTLRIALDQEAHRDTADLADLLAEGAQVQLQRYELWGRREILDEAVELIDRAWSGASGQGAPSPSVATTRGEIYRHVYEIGGDPTMLEASISSWQSAALHEHGDAQASALAGLAKMIFSRFKLHGNDEDLRQSIELARHALSLAETTHTRATVCNSLGNILCAAHRSGMGIETLDEAVEVLRHAVSLDVDVSSSPLHLHSLGAALTLRGRESGSADDLREAAERVIEAQRQLPLDAPEAVNMANTLATIFFYRADAGTSLRPEDIDRTINVLVAAIERAQPASPLYFQLLCNLAAFRNIRWQTSGAEADARDALAAYRLAASHEATSAALACHLGIQWSKLAIRLQDWDEAVDACRLALAKVDYLTAGNASRSAKEQWIEEFQALGSGAVLAFAKTGRLEEAVVALENTSAILLRQSLAPSEVTPGDGINAARGVMPQPMQLSDILAASRRAPLVYLSTHLKEGLAFIVDEQATPPVTCVWLPALVAENAAKCGIFLVTLNNTGADLRAESKDLETVCRWMWEAVVDPVFSRRERWESVTLVPTGLLSLLPLHIACGEMNGAGVRTYAVDRALLSYAPNAHTLLRRVGQHNGTAAHICVVANPTPSAAPDLHGAEMEGAWSASYFRSASVLQGTAATRSDVLAAIEKAPVLHFACHAHANFDDPLASGLRMANDEMITVEDLLRIPLGDVQLAVLSACESGVPGTRLIAEVIGLPTALLQAGVQSVVATMWSVDDFATLLLVDRFFFLWRRQGLRPPEALGRAQQWLRDTTNAEKARDLACHRDEEVHPNVVATLMANGADARTYRNPYYWGAFSFAGIP